MDKIKKCPYCKSGSRLLIAEQIHEDKYLALVNYNLNKKRRFWYKCEQCSFIYRSPMVSTEESRILYSKYRSYEFPKITPEEYFDKLTSIPDNESETYAKAKFISKHIRHAGSILDVGCGGGIFLYQLRKFYPDSYILGLEPNSLYAEMIKKKMGIDIVQDFYKPDNIDHIFDLTVSTDVIEHIHDINTFWASAANNVHCNKYLFIEIPSPDNFQTLDISHDVFESPHLYFFNNKHVNNLADQYGFDQIAYHNVMQRDVSKDWFLFQKKGR